MEPRGQIFRNGSAETPRQMADRAMDDFGNDDLDAAMAEHFSACPNCGAAGGSPVHIRGQESAATGYVDDFDGCSRCCEDHIEMARRLRG